MRILRYQHELVLITAINALSALKGTQNQETAAPYKANLEDIADKKIFRPNHHDRQYVREVT